MKLTISNYVQSALGSSFNIPPPPPKNEAPVSSQEKESAHAPAASAPVPGLDEWPQTLQGYLDEWQAESAVARAKAEATRKRFEEERAAEIKAVEDAKKMEKKNKEDEEKRKRDAERLRRELEGEEDEVHGGKGHGHGDKSKVKEAWELVAKKEEQSKDTPVVETCARGVNSEDVRTGQVRAVSTCCSTGNHSSNWYPSPYMTPLHRPTLSLLFSKTRSPSLPPLHPQNRLLFPGTLPPLKHGKKSLAGLLAAANKFLLPDPLALTTLSKSHPTPKRLLKLLFPLPSPLRLRLPSLPTLHPCQSLGFSPSSVLTSCCLSSTVSCSALVRSLHGKS